MNYLKFSLANFFKFKSVLTICIWLLNHVRCSVMSGLELSWLSGLSIEWIFPSVRMVGTNLRLHFLELIQLVQLFSAFWLLHRCLKGHSWNLILRQGWSTCVITGWFCEFLKFLLLDYGLILCYMLIIGDNAIDIFNDGTNRSRRPIGHAVRELDIFGLLIIAHLSLIVRANLAPLIILFSSRVAQTD